MKVIDSGIAAARSPGRQSNTFPGVCALPSGRWLCGFRGAPQKSPNRGNKACLIWSDDEGASWTESWAPFEPPTVDGRSGVLRAAYPTALGGSNVLLTLMWVDMSEPDLPLFNEATEGILDTRIFFALSQDDGETWSCLWALRQEFYQVPLALTGPTMVMPNGDWGCQVEVNKHYYETSAWRHSSVLLFSADQGDTWPVLSVASNDPENRVFYWDQRPVLLKNGRLLDAFWTYDNGAATYLNIHAREFHNGIWSPMWDAGVPGQPAPIAELEDGRLAMVYVDRSGAPTLKVRTSGDGGHTWPECTEVILHESKAASQTWKKSSMQDAWAEMGKFSLGLPSCARLPSGDLLVVFYSGPATDETDIRWIRLRTNQK